MKDLGSVTETPFPPIYIFVFSHSNTIFTWAQSHPEYKSNCAASLVIRCGHVSKFWPYMGCKQTVTWQFLETLRNNWYMPFVFLLLWSFLAPAA